MKFLKVVVVFGATVLGALFANLGYAYSNGNSTGGETCAPCHGASPSSATTVMHRGVSGALTPGTGASFDVVVNNPSKAAAGFNMAIYEVGVGLPAGGRKVYLPASALGPNNGVAIQNGEFVHNAPKTGMPAVFTFTWMIDAATPASTYAMKVAANAVDLDGTSSGDQWNVANTMYITLATTTGSTTSTTMTLITTTSTTTTSTSTSTTTSIPTKPSYCADYQWRFFNGQWYCFPEGTTSSTSTTTYTTTSTTVTTTSTTGSTTTSTSSTTSTTTTTSTSGTTTSTTTTTMEMCRYTNIACYDGTGAIGYTYSGNFCYFSGCPGGMLKTPPPICTDGAPAVVVDYYSWACVTTTTTTETTTSTSTTTDTTSTTGAPPSTLPTDRYTTPADLPAAAAYCGYCHGLTIGKWRIAQAPYAGAPTRHKPGGMKKDKWKRIITKMMNKEGCPVPSAEVNDLARYYASLKR